MLKLGNKLNYWTFFWVFFYILLFGFLLRNSFSYLDSDLGWHLKVGEQISKTKIVPHLNNFNYTYSGNWVDHEWFVNLLSFKIYNNYGYFALSIFFALVVIVSLILLNLFIRRYYKKASQPVLIFLQLFGLAACLPHLGIRMQEFGFLFLILELWIIKDFTEKKKWRHLIWLLPLFYLWSNMHGSFLLGLVILFSWPIIKLIENRLSSGRFYKYLETTEILNKKNIYIFLAFVLGSALVTFFTPYGLELYSFLGGYGNTFYLSHIQEWLPQYYFPFNYWQSSYLAMIIFLELILLKNSFAQKRFKLNLWELFIISVMFILAIRSHRHFPLLFVATLPFLALALTELTELKKIPAAFFNKYLKWMILVALILLATQQFILLKVINKPFDNYCWKYPCEAKNFLRSEEKYSNFNILNEYNWGGYLIESYPEKILFIDGRIPQALYKGHTFLEEYNEFYLADADFQAKLVEYNIKLVLIKTSDTVIKVHRWEKIFFNIKDSDLIKTNYLRVYLENSRDWNIIYQDPTATIYFKEN